MTFNRVFFLSCLLALANISMAQLSAPKYSNEFLAIGVGARALGMSNSLVSSTADVYSAYWNPAGLMGIESDLQLGGMHAEYFAGIANYNYAGIATPLDSVSAGGISIIRFGVDDIPNTTDLIDSEGNVDYDRIVSFSAADYAFILSYARKLKPGLDIGLNAKIIYRHVGDFASAIGFGFDVGMVYRKNDWMFAAMARDVTSTFNSWTFNLDERTEEVFLLTENEIPTNSVEVTLPRIILGVAHKWDFNKVSLLAEINFDLTTDGKRNVLISADPVSVDPHFGFEFGYENKLFLRGGVGNIQQAKSEIFGEEWTFQPNIGIGLRIKELSLDYALTDIGDASAALYSNVFSVKFNIWKSDAKTD